MYENRNNVRTEEKIENAQLVKNFFAEKNVLDKKYTSLLGDVKH
jgi:hypothetical protein